MAKRFERKERYRVRLTKRDLAIVEAVFEARYLTNELVRQLFFKPTTFSWCKQRMRYLFDLGYLKKRQVHINEPDIYCLGLKGRRYIARIHETYAQDEIDKIAGVPGPRSGAPMLMMSHDLTLSQLFVNGRLECQRLGLTMRWKNTRMLELMKLGLEPDAFITVGYGHKERAAFIEFTGVLPTTNEMKQKLSGYEHYLESQRCQTDFGVPNLAVLWLTTSHAKSDKIRQVIERSLYPDYFLIGLVEDAGQFVTAPMWCWSETEEPVSWLKPPDRESQEGQQ